VGDWRIVYEVDDERRRVVIIRIAHRSDVYRRLERLSLGSDRHGEARPVQTPVQTSRRKMADLQEGSNPVCAFSHSGVDVDTSFEGFDGALPQRGMRASGSSSFL
jgi:hypothetical protein